MKVYESHENEWKRKYPRYELTPFEEQVIPYAMIRQYEYCPRRAKYDYVYELRTESGGFRFFKRQLREALSWVADLTGEGVRPTEDEVQLKVEELWAETSRSQQKMTRLYKDQAFKCAKSFAARLPLNIKVELDRVWQWDVPNMQPPTTIAFKVDELEKSSTPVARLHRLDIEHPTHMEDPIWSLYAALALAEGMEEMEFGLSYLANDEEVPRDLVDAQEWADRQRAKLYRVVRQIRLGEFKPIPRDFNFSACHRCPYNLICPA